MTDREAATQPERNLGKRRAILGVIAVVALLLAYVFATSFLPRWWAHRVGAMSNGTFRWGVWWGLVFGFLCTVVPVFVARQAVWRQIRWRTKGWILVAALLLAAPNLLTLGIVLGSGKAAHAGERTLDTDAPGFRGATLVGVVLGIALVIVVEVLLTKRRRHSRELTHLRVEKKIRDAQER